jgi:DNA-binding response OmpR family regulator
VAPAREQRELLSRWLRRYRFDVATVRDESEALDRIGDFLLGARSRRFELVVVDVRVRQRGGLGLFLGLRRGDWRPPVILIVASGDEALRAETASFGAATVLEWPVALDTFARAVQAIRQPGLQRSG